MLQLKGVFKKLAAFQNWHTNKSPQSAGQNRQNTRSSEYQSCRQGGIKRGILLPVKEWTSQIFVSHIIAWLIYPITFLEIEQSKANHYGSPGSSKRKFGATGTLATALITATTTCAGTKLSHLLLAHNRKLGCLLSYLRSVDRSFL